MSELKPRAWQSSIDKTVTTTSEETAKAMTNPTPLYALEDIGIIRADVLALCEAIIDYNYVEDEFDIDIAKRISERLRGGEWN